MRKTPIDQMERVARLYRSNKEASEALGITVQAFSRICRQHGIETPHKRQQRGRQRFADAAG
jgi:histone H3/H4